MRIGFIGDNDLEGVERDAAFAVAHGFDGLEYNYWQGFRDLDAGTVEAMADIHRRHGVGVSMLGLWGWNHLDPDDGVRGEAHAMLERAIGFARTLGAEHLAVGAGDVPGQPPGYKVERFLAVWPPLLEKIAAAGLDPVFYPLHGASFFDGLAAYEAVWAKLPAVKIKFDPANWSLHGDDYMEVVRRYGNKVGYVHVKEHLYHDGALAAQPPAGMGDIAFPKVLAFLYEHGYDGWLSIEPHGPVWSKGVMREKMLLITKRYLERWLV